MSTRANIIIKDECDTLHFYRHSDGYPSGALPTLNIFMDWVKSGVIRNNVDQAAGWLIVLGAIEYGSLPEYKFQEPHSEGGKRYGDVGSIKHAGKPDSMSDWKVGAYEPTTGLHGDVEFIYEIDLQKQAIEVYRTDRKLYWDDPSMRFTTKITEQAFAEAAKDA